VHRLSALVLAGTPEQRALLAAAGLRVVRLSDAFLLVPLTSREPGWYERLAAQYPGSEKGPSGSCRWLGGPEARLARQLSRSAPVAYVETNYFGGAGSQAATVFSGGPRVLRRPRAAYGPINEALRALGVPREGGYDPFDTLGLGRYRETGSWLREATEP
jgi:hypothetical protein